MVNDADRLLEDDQFTYTYDANGNLTSQTDKVTSDVTTYNWNAQDQLIRIDRPGGTVVTYAYDALGRRIEKNVDGTIARYVYDGDDIYLETDGAGALVARYAHGDLVDQPLSVERGGSDFFYHADHQGSIRQVTNAAGTVVNEYEYDSYGRFLSRVETVPQPYGYTGREQDEESDLYYYRARYYDANTGRFISEDPVEFQDGINNYSYTDNKPVRFEDPSGQLKGAIVTAGIKFGINLASKALKELSKKGSKKGAPSKKKLRRSLIGEAGATLVGSKTDKHVCKVKCNVSQRGPGGGVDCKGADCPPTVTGIGTGNTPTQAFNNAQKAANRKLPDNSGCHARHCDGIAGSCKGMSSR